MKYTVIKEFIDKYDKTLYKVNTIIEISEVRAKEILTVDKLIERVEEPQEVKAEEVKIEKKNAKTKSKKSK